MDVGETVGMVSLYFTETFDTVNHCMLCSKQGTYESNFMVEDWVQAFISNIHFKVRVNGQITDFRSFEIGVPVFGPTLLLLVIKNLLDALESKVMLFTDDA